VIRSVRARPVPTTRRIFGALAQAAPRTWPTIEPAPAAPAAPAPAEALVTHGRTTLSRHDGEDAYVLVQDGHNLMDASLDDLREANRLAGDGGALLWFRHDGRRYVVRDPTALARFQALHAQSLRLAETQAALGDRQGDLGDRQGELGERMAQLSEQLTDSATRQAEAAVAASRAAGDQAQRARTAALRASERMRHDALGEQLQALARQQAQLGLQQAELGKQQADASLRARQQAEELIRQAIAQGLATPIGG